MDFLLPRNIVADGPDVFSSLMVLAVAPSERGAEGSPIYTTLDAEGDATGTWSSDDWDYTFTGSGSAIAQKTREAARDQIGGIDVENYEIVRDHSENSWMDVGAIISYDPDKFYAEQGQILGCNGGTPPFAPPLFRTDQQLISYVPGLKTSIIDPLITEETSTELVITPPYFTGSIQAGTLKMVVRLDVLFDDAGGGLSFSESFTVETDCSTWDSTDFRDIRGTYGTTSYDTNGIEYVWSVTIG